MFQFFYVVLYVALRCEPYVAVRYVRVESRHETDGWVNEAGDG